MAYWALAALKTQRTQRKEPFAWRYGIVFMEVVGFTLMFDGDADIGVSRPQESPAFSASPRRHDPCGPGSDWLWARWHLGQYWSGRFTIKEDHKLIRTGPYARLRNPIYSGLDLAAIGSTWRLIDGDAWREPA